MKRILCAALLGAAAIPAVPAHAIQEIRPHVTVRTENGVGVGTAVTINGNYQPLVGVQYYSSTGEVCVGFSYQVPLCAGGPISIDDPLD